MPRSEDTWAREPIHSEHMTFPSFPRSHNDVSCSGSKIVLIFCYCHACPASEKGPGAARRPIRSSLCVPMMPSLQRGPAKSILTPGQIDGPSSRVCLGLAALTYVPTPRDSPIHISPRSPCSLSLSLSSRAVSIC